MSPVAVARSRWLPPCVPAAAGFFLDSGGTYGVRVRFPADPAWWWVRAGGYTLDPRAAHCGDLGLAGDLAILLERHHPGARAIATFQ